MKLPRVSHAFLTLASILMCNVGWAVVPPEIAISPTSLTSNLFTGEVETQQIIISNPGGSDLNWQIVEGTADCFASPSDVPWLSVSPSAGTTPPGGSVAVDVTADATGLTSGVYTGNLCVDNNADPAAFPTVPVTLTVVSLNEPPTCNEASPSIMHLWPPNHEFADVQVLGVTDPDGDLVTIEIDGIYQDEPVSGKGSGNTTPDGTFSSTDLAAIRAERDGKGDGRVYHIVFTAYDGNGGACTGEVMVSVPHDQSGAPAVDGGALYDSTGAP